MKTITVKTLDGLNIMTIVINHIVAVMPHYQDRNKTSIFVAMTDGEFVTADSYTDVMAKIETI